MCIGFFSVEERRKIKKTECTVVNSVRKHFDFLDWPVLLQIIIYKCHSHIMKVDLFSLAQTLWFL